MGMHVLSKPRRQRIPALCSTHKLQLLNSRRASDAPASESPLKLPFELWSHQTGQPPHSRRTLPFLHCLVALHRSAAPRHKVSLAS